MQLAHLTPDSFRESLSLITFLIAILFSFLSLIPSLREHCLRMSGLFLLVSVALFANNAYSYFAAVFIVATAVTQLEFLQNLAAIIRGSKEYFDYQKEYLSQREVEASVEADVLELEAAPDEIEEIETPATLTVSIDRANITPTQFALLVEEYAFKFLEKKYGKPIQRHVRFKGETYSTEFDGVMQGDSMDLVFEIKTSRRVTLPMRYIRESAKRLVGRVREYQKITRRAAALRFILIGNFPAAYLQRIIQSKDQLLDDLTDISITFEAYSFDEIGLPDLIPSIEGTD
jgi:hypothetical protein